MNVEKLAMEVGRRLAKHADQMDSSDLAMPVAAGVGAAAGGWAGAHRDDIRRFMQKDPDVSRIIESLRGIAGRIDGKVSRNSATAGALAGAGIGLAGAAGAYGLKKLYDMNQEREHMRGQLASQPQYSPMQYGG